MDNFSAAINFNTLLTILKKSDRYVYRLFSLQPYYNAREYAGLCSAELNEELSAAEIESVHSSVKRAFDALPVDVKILKITDDLFPQSVKDVPFLYLRGDEKLLNKKGVSIVGTRFPGQRGKTLACNAATEISKAGYPVISGLALGIDGCAHLQTLKEGKQTVAVLGTPINVVYPYEHTDLQEAIAQEGLLVSQFSPCLKVQKYYFMVRNMLMSRLNCACLVVESEDGGGGVSHARYTEQQGKFVFVFKEVYDNNAYQWPKSFKSPCIIEKASQIPEKLATLNLQEEEKNPQLELF